MLRKLTLAACALAATTAAIIALPGVSMAQEDWPNKPVRVLVGFGPGGGTDVATRVIAEGLSDVLKQQFVVENRPGAGGSIAGGQIAKADKDGYNLLAVSMGHAVSAVMVANVPYHPVDDFTPIGIFANSAFVVIVPKDSPAKDLKGLVKHINSLGGKLNYSTVGLGSTQHLIAEDLVQRTGMKAQQVSYRTTGDVVAALRRGDASFAVELFHAVRGQLDSGEIRIVAMATPERWPEAPKIPTAAESGLKGFGATAWYGLMAPAGTPKPIVDRLSKALKEVVGREDVKKRLANIGALAGLTGPDEFAKTINSNVETFRSVAERAGLKAK